MNEALRRTLDSIGKPHYRIARDAGMSRTQLFHIIHGIRAARPEERAALARVLGKTDAELFPPEEAVAV